MWQNRHFGLNLVVLPVLYLGGKSYQHIITKFLLIRGRVSLEMKLAEMNLLLFTKVDSWA